MASRLLWLAALSATLVNADGTGLLGLGRWLYKPTCAHTCRYVLRMQHLLCEAPSNVTNPYEPAGSHDPSCFLLDAAFLKTTALCIEEYCGREDDVRVSEIEEWWEGHLATGTLGDWREEMRPVVTYTEALRLAKEDEKDGDLPEVVEMEWMNVTSWVPEEIFNSNFFYQKGFQGESVLQLRMTGQADRNNPSRRRDLAWLQFVRQTDPKVLVDPQANFMQDDHRNHFCRSPHPAFPLPFPSRILSLLQPLTRVPRPTSHRPPSPHPNASQHWTHAYSGTVHFHRVHHYHQCRSDAGAYTFILA